MSPCRFPLERIYFYLTEGCNLTCRHCWLAPAPDGGGGRLPTLPVDLFEEIIAGAKPLGLSGVKLTGGEPLLHPQFVRLLAIVRREELALSIETNGQMLTPALAAAIARAGDPSVAVSLDGADAETHEWVRGAAGSFGAAASAVTSLAAAGVRPQVVCSVMRRNASQLGAIVRMAEALGAASVKFNIVQPVARGAQLLDKGDTLTVAELIELGRRVNTEISPRTRLQVLFDVPPAFRPLRQFADGGGFGRCQILSTLGVLASGGFSLCGIGMTVPGLVFGNARTDRIEDVWRHNETLGAIRRRLLRQLSGVCGHCLMQRSCLGSCVAQNFSHKGESLSAFWFCEAADAQGLFPTSRKTGAAWRPEISAAAS
jgi:SynChlorMet cassette radical SAM/SPASM protein ScmF